MLKRSILFGLAAATLFLGMKAGAEAAVANPALGTTAGEISAITDVRWVCGPYRCAWIPDYPGPVVVRPYMRGWAAPPRPHCNYVRGPRGWALICP